MGGIMLMYYIDIWDGSFNSLKFVIFYNNFKISKVLLTILSALSFGGEVKPSVPCRKFTVCKRTQKWRGCSHFWQNPRQFLAHSSTFRCWGSLVLFQTLVTPCGESWNVLITGPPGWGFDVPLATALCKNLPAKNTQR